MNQNDLIQDHLERGKKLTPIAALQKFGCFRLSARIYDLRKKGLDIKQRMVYIKRNTQVAQYWI